MRRANCTLLEAAEALEKVLYAPHPAACLRRYMPGNRSHVHRTPARPRAPAIHGPADKCWACSIGAQEKKHASAHAAGCPVRRGCADLAGAGAVRGDHMRHARWVLAPAGRRVGRESRIAS
jgi:hypothetical protein